MKAILLASSMLVLATGADTAEPFAGMTWEQILALVHGVGGEVIEECWRTQEICTTSIDFRLQPGVWLRVLSYKRIDTENVVKRAICSFDPGLRLWHCADFDTGGTFSSTFANGPLKNAW